MESTVNLVRLLHKSNAEELMDDDDFLKAAAAISGMKKSDIKDALKEVKKSAKDIETKAYENSIGS